LFLVRVLLLCAKDLFINAVLAKEMLGEMRMRRLPAPWRCCAQPDIMEATNKSLAQNHKTRTRARCYQQAIDKRSYELACCIMHNMCKAVNELSEEQRHSVAT